MSKKSKKLKKEIYSANLEKDLVVAEVINLPKCKYCSQLAMIKIVRENKNAEWVCSSCFNRISSGRKVKRSSSVEGELKLQNRKEKYGVTLFKSSSVVTPKNAKWNLGEKKQKINKNSDEEMFFSLAWEWGDKMNYSLWGDDNKILCEYNDRFIVFEQTGKPVGELNSYGKLYVIYTQ